MLFDVSRVALSHVRMANRRVICKAVLPAPVLLDQPLQQIHCLAAQLEIAKAQSEMPTCRFSLKVLRHSVVEA